MAVWRVLLNVSLADLPVNGITGIDASGFERVHPYSLHEAGEPHYPAVEDDAAGRHIDQRRSRHSRDDDTKTRYADCATGGETERGVYRSVDW